MFYRLLGRIFFLFWVTPFIADFVKKVIYPGVRGGVLDAVTKENKRRQREDERNERFQDYTAEDYTAERAENGSTAPQFESAHVSDDNTDLIIPELMAQWAGDGNPDRHHGLAFSTGSNGCMIYGSLDQLDWLGDKIKDRKSVV